MLLQNQKRLPKAGPDLRSSRPHFPSIRFTGTARSRSYVDPWTWTPGLGPLTGRLFGIPVGKNEPQQGQGQGQGQGQDHEKVRCRRAALQLQRVLALNPDPGPNPAVVYFSPLRSQRAGPRNYHETDFYKAKTRIDDLNLHKRTGQIQPEWWRRSVIGSKVDL